MSIRMTSKIALPLLLTFASSVAGAVCVPVIGTARLLPDAACTIRTVAQPGTPASLFGGDCFSVQLSLAGFPAATGYAGNTIEPMASLVPGAPATVAPVAVPAVGSPLPRQIVQTARTTMWLGHGARRTAIYTTDVVVIQPQLSATGQVVPKLMTEQILISGSDGKGAFANVSGHLNVMGTTVGAPSAVTGQICMP